MTGKRFKMSVARTKATGIILEHELSTDEVYNLLMDYKEENEQLKSKLEESKKAHSNCDKLWWELHDEKEQLEKENEKLKSENERLCNFNLHNILDKKNKEIEQLKSVNQELRKELQLDAQQYKIFIEVINEADDLICSHLSKHYQRQWKNFCKTREIDV